MISVKSQTTTRTSGIRTRKKVKRGWKRKRNERGRLLQGDFIQFERGTA